MHKFVFVTATAATANAIIELVADDTLKHRAKVITVNPNGDLICELLDSPLHPKPTVWATTSLQTKPAPLSPVELELADARRLLGLAETSLKKHETDLAAARGQLTADKQAAQTKADAQAGSIASLTAELETLKAAAKPSPVTVSPPVPAKAPDAKKT